MKKVKGIVIYILLVFMALLTMPFSVVYADTLDQTNIKGVNFECIDITPIENTNEVNNGNTYQRAIYTFHFQAVLDQSYYGYVNGRFLGTFSTYETYYDNGVLKFRSANKEANSYARTYYVCGQTIDFYMQAESWMIINQTSMYAITYDVKSFTLSGSNVVPFGYQSSLNQIIDDIEDMQIEQQNISSYLYDSDSGSIIEQVMTTNDLITQAGQMFFTMMLYTEEIMLDVGILRKMRQFNIPTYSLGLVYPSFKYFDLYENIYNSSVRITDYPVFIIPSGYTNNEFSKIWVPTNSKGYIIYGTTGGVGGVNSTTYKLNYTGSPSRSSSYIYNFWIEGMYMEVYKVQFTTGDTASTITLQINNNSENDLYFMPIMFFCPRNYQFPTDFSLEYDIPNSMVQNIEIIANGTVSSNESASDLEDLASEFTVTSDNVIGIEDTIGNGFTGALQNVPTSFDFLSNFGASFISSAQWVRDQYNNMTVGNPFGSLITFSLILGIGLLLLGRKLL